MKPLDLVYAVKGHIWPYLPNAAVAPVYAQEGVRGHGAFGVFQIIRCQDSDFGLDTGLKAEFSTAHRFEGRFSTFDLRHGELFLKFVSCASPALALRL